jgi:hypothetical protein
MTVLVARALFELPVPAAVSQTPVEGHDLFNDPPMRQPNFRAPEWIVPARRIGTMPMTPAERQAPSSGGRTTALS